MSESKQSFASFVLALKKHQLKLNIFCFQLERVVHFQWTFPIFCIAMAAQFDVILFGATGFTGSLMLKYLAQKTGVKYALCGRNKGKLEQAIAETWTVEVGL